ncbi:hypothetical protein GFY24_04465 [Nocardia sp. SYP-A9097]|uniref:hypothetical protein n=1 Tax=Nocardia sp. SYP-A9097 TaxID=2663237 RepID=UPI00129B3790|nr:hypothetical protein [Nocardia sp. SYP-A9097]MRH86729.1 hypothetical protein [Nocardia sp. SYP-A9097]
MSTIWLPFLLGLTLGSILVWFTTLLPVPTRHPSTDCWTVAAITSRLEYEHQLASVHPQASKPTVAKHL